MILHEQILVSEELLKDEFVCNLSACKGACCIEGEGGAPLTKEEHFLLEEQWDKLKPYLSETSVKAIETQGFGVIGLDGELETPLINGAECVYVTRKEDGSLACGIEQANNDGELNFMKPESCHLYPIRVQQLPTFESLLYHKWDICSPACALGAELKVPVYKFLKQALTRKYGADWYAELERIADEYRASIGLKRLKHD